MRVGAWWDVGARIPLDHWDAHKRAIVEMGIQAISVMVNSMKAPEWDWNIVTEKQFRELHRRLIGLGVDVYLCSWMRPRREMIQQFRTRAIPVIKELACLMEFDLEGHWRVRYLDGYPSMREAEDDLVAAVHESGPVPVWGVTAHTGRLQGDIGSRAMEYAIQAYSISARATDPRYDWGGELGPGRRQEWAARKAENATGHVPSVGLILGLPAWDQDGYHGHTADEAMGACWDACEAMGCEEVRYWSWKWLAGYRGDRVGYARDFLARKRIANL